ncbi:MAG TPA: trypsin-like peptidase domain-containing protein [Pirellulaceae bacterium]|nr:trypsin-like peptidase domain-containing protein [Pirellulaceae bacterium]
MNRSITLVSIVVMGSTAATCAAQDQSAGTLLAPKAFRAAAAKVEPSLVRIEGFGGITASAGGGYQAPGEGPTTGLIISSDGYIITSTFNFLRKPPVITVILAPGQRRIARLLGRDETRKICLLKVDGVSDLPVPQFAPRGELKVGQWAVAIGAGFGAKQTAISAGIISATTRISGQAVQTDANTSPANYGGPLIDLDGRVIGICVPLTPGAQKEAAGTECYDSGIGFAVPLDGLDGILDRLKSGQTLQHAFLGVHCHSFGDPPTGAQITTVVPHSAAAKAGLVEGDKIVVLGGTEILDTAHLATVIHGFLAGDKIEITVVRGSEWLTVTAELVPLPVATPIAPSEKPDQGQKPKPGPPNRPQPELPPL